MLASTTKRLQLARSQATRFERRALNGHRPRAPSVQTHAAGPSGPAGATAARSNGSSPASRVDAALLQADPVGGSSKVVKPVAVAEEAGSFVPPESASVPNAAACSLPPREERPGVVDEQHFEMHWSVQHCKDRPINMYNDPRTQDPLGTYARKLGESLQKSQAFSDATSAAYWAYHLARMGFLSVQSGVPLVLQSILSGEAQKGGFTFLFGAMTPQVMVQTNMDYSNDSIGTFEVDLRNIKERTYKLPWDMTTPGHRQFNPFFVAEEASRYIPTQVEIWKRRSTADMDEYANRMPYRPSTLYPEYYQRDFHFQLDGWFGSRFANLYDVTTECLFLGSQDAMQRSTLIPMAMHLSKSKGEGLQFLEVGAGTGRFATFVRDNYPLASMLVTDLSPFYIEKARETMAYWERVRGSEHPLVGTTEFMQCAAESIDIPDESQDVVYNVYMFHEMPADARQEALREMARVLKPGGLLVITDSVQLGDKEERDTGLDRFTKLNEPYYTDYVRFDMGSAFKSVGLQPYLKCMHSYTKCVSAIKPIS